MRSRNPILAWKTTTWPQSQSKWDCLHPLLRRANAKEVRCSSFRASKKQQAFLPAWVWRSSPNYSVNKGSALLPLSLQKVSAVATVLKKEAESFVLIWKGKTQVFAVRPILSGLSTNGFAFPWSTLAARQGKRRLPFICGVDLEKLGQSRGLCGFS